MRIARALIALSFVVVSMASATAWATVITVKNASFEAPVLTEGGVTGFQDWTHSIVAAANTGQCRQALCSDQVGLSGYTGDQAAYLYVGGSPSAVGYQNLVSFHQVLDATAQAGQSYTLTADLVGLATCAGSKNVGSCQLGMYLGYMNGSTFTPLASRDYSFSELYNTANWTLQTKSISTATIASGAPAVGNNLVILFGIDAVTSDSVNFLLDNVRVSSVPEPSALALMTMGMFGILAYAWRKRN